MQMWRQGWCPRCQRDHQSCYLLLAHPLNGGHIASSGSGKYKYKCVCATPYRPRQLGQTIVNTQPIMLYPSVSQVPWQHIDLVQAIH